MRRKGSSAPRGGDQVARDGDRVDDGDDVVLAGPRGARAAAQAGSDRRAAPRVLVDLEVDYRLEDNYLFAYITDISATGIFVRTTTPEPPGTRLNLRFVPRPTMAAVPVSSSSSLAAASQRLRRQRDDADADADAEADDGGDDHGDDGDDADDADDAHDQPLELEGEVIWVNPFRPGAPDSLHPGMGIRFIALDDSTRRRLIDLVRRFAYLG